MCCTSLRKSLGCIPQPFNPNGGEFIPCGWRILYKLCLSTGVTVRKGCWYHIILQLLLASSIWGKLCLKCLILFVYYCFLFFFFYKFYFSVHLILTSQLIKCPAKRHFKQHCVIFCILRGVGHFYPIIAMSKAYCWNAFPVMDTFLPRF